MSCQCTCGRPGCASIGGAKFLPRTHGTKAMYDSGCRCDSCCRKESDHHRKRRARIAGETSERALKAGQEWTGPELEIATRPDLSAREAAMLLGRTAAAVEHARKRCRRDPRFMALLGRSRLEGDGSVPGEVVAS